MKIFLSLFILVNLFVIYEYPTQLYASGNQVNQSFNRAKKQLEHIVYTGDVERRTIYCNAVFDNQKNITLPVGFETKKYAKRANHIEWEHIVPAENFGRTFSEWRDGHPECVKRDGKPFKGRKCAEKTNREYRLMQADLYNLYPAIGVVNAARSNYNFTMLSPEIKPNFGVCEMKIDERKVQPPKNARGQIARVYLYMEATYTHYKMSDVQHKLMLAWNTMFPVTRQECIRTKKIEELQKNENIYIKQPCLDAGLW